MLFHAVGLFLLVLPAAAQRNVLLRPNQLKPSEMLVQAVVQDREGDWYHLRGHATVETDRVLLRADEIDYNDDTGDSEARGNVYLKRYTTGEELWADHVEYNLAEETGKFYNVHGTSPLQQKPRQGILTSTSPFYFQGKWAERIQDRYILHDGFITNCKLPNPWWVLRGPRFDIVPDQRALAYRTVFRLKHIPLLYAPVLYKSLEKEPRKSGFLTPNIGNSSRRGKMIGVGYYWAINRSYDAAYRAQYFTTRGIAHNIDLRGQPLAGTDFNFTLYGVNDRGLPVTTKVTQPNGTVQDKTVRIKQGGYFFSFLGHSDLGHGFYARADANYLSSFTFRQAFTESYNEAITSEVHSTGFVGKDWSYYGFDVAMQRNENFQSTRPGDTIVIRKLPEASIVGRDRQLWGGRIPLWLSFDASAGLLSRQQLLFETRAYMERMDVEPRFTSAIRLGDFSLIPSYALRRTYWGESRLGTDILGSNISRNAGEGRVTIVMPSLARVFPAPKWLGDRLEHVIEPRAEYRNVTGVSEYQKLVRFDNTELMTNTNELEISITNRLYAKQKDGSVNEVLSWEVKQARYFDPTFGGAVLPGQRNVILSSIELTPFAFLDGPRNYSPVVSVFKLSPRPGFSLDWRTDYDPLRHSFVNTGLSADVRFSKYFVSVGQNSVHAIPLKVPGQTLPAGDPCSAQLTGAMRLLSPCANQFRGTFGIGNENRRGWNAAFSSVYDWRSGVLQYGVAQVTYNSDCCGFSVQYRRFSWSSNFISRNDNMYRFSFNVANIGAFGTLKKQERLF